MRQLVDSRLRNGIPDHWPSRCTIQTLIYTEDAANQPVLSGVKNVAGLVNIECRLGPMQEGTPSDDEVRTEPISSVVSKRQLKLNGYYTQIVPKSMQVVVDGVVYPIRGVESDSQHFSTRLRLEIVEP